MASYSRPPDRAPTLASLSLLLFRIGCGSALLYFHGWDSAVAAWNRIWKAQPWPLIEHLESINYPFPLVLSVAAAIVCVIAPLSVILGFLTRLSALLIVAVILFVLPVSLGGGAPLAQELSLFYLLAFFLLVLQGGGSFGLDSVFGKKKGA